MKRWLFIGLCFFILCLLLCGCQNITKQATKQAITDLNAIEQQITSIEGKLTPECKTLVYDDLNQLKTDLNEAKDSVKLINANCTAEKDILKKDNRIKNFWIVLLLATVSFLLYSNVKK